MRIVFMGTPDFSVSALDALYRSTHEIVAVVTQPDRPTGRGGRMTPPAVKARAMELGLPVYQYEKISREGVEDLLSFAPDVIVTAAYGQILSQEVLSIAPHGVLNVHASLLPKYRGSSPIQWSIINGEVETGITIMRTALKVDSGDILLQKSMPIDPYVTAGELFDKLAVLGGEALIEALDLVERGQAVYTPQVESDATHCRMLTKADGAIDFAMDSLNVHNHVRGMNPWPGAFATHEGTTYKIFDTRPVEGRGLPGEILYADTTHGLVVACKEGAISINVQAPGGKRMPVTDYLRGHSFEVGSRFDV